MKTLICVAGLLLAAPVSAESPIDETRPLAADGRVSIENLKGRVTVRTWDQPSVRITGTLGDKVEALDVEGNGQALSIVVRNPENGGWFSRSDDSGPTTLEVTLPARASLVVEAVSADIDVTGTGGRLLQLESVSGDVRVRGALAAETRLESVSGTVDAEIESSDIDVSSVSGDVRAVGRIEGRVVLGTVSGDVELASGSVERLTVETVSGDATLATRLAAGGAIDAESVSGDLVLTLPRDTSSRLRAESFSGRIRSPVGTVETEEFGPGSQLRTRLGDGNGEIILESFSGNVQVVLE